MPVAPESHTLATSWGDITARTLNACVVRCTLPLLSDNPAIPFAVITAERDSCSQFIRELLEGGNPQRPPVAFLEGTAFQIKVWNALLSIPRGEIRTYGQLATELGMPQAYRAVANACGKNPAPLFVPCHRVVGANGEWGGFSAGLAWKRLLLGLEGVARF